MPNGPPHPVVLPKWLFALLRSSAPLTLAIMMYGAWVAFIQMPSDSGHSRWLVLVVGVALGAWAWYQTVHSATEAKERHAEGLTAQAEITKALTSQQTEINNLSTQLARLTDEIQTLQKRPLETPEDVRVVAGQLEEYADEASNLMLMMQGAIRSQQRLFAPTIRLQYGGDELPVQPVKPSTSDSEVPPSTGAAP